MRHVVMRQIRTLLTALLATSLLSLSCSTPTESLGTIPLTSPVDETTIAFDLEGLEILVGRDNLITSLEEISWKPPSPNRGPNPIERLQELPSGQHSVAEGDFSPDRFVWAHVRRLVSRGRASVFRQGERIPAIQLRRMGTDGTSWTEILDEDGALLLSCCAISR